MKNEDIDRALEIIKDYKSRSNKELIFVMDLVKEDFELTKKSLIRLSNHLDKLENTYNLILKEFENRTNVKKGSE
jgi:hypothetical protein